MSETKLTSEQFLVLVGKVREWDHTNRELIFKGKVYGHEECEVVIRKTYSFCEGYGVSVFMEGAYQGEVNIGPESPLENYERFQDFYGFVKRDVELREQKKARQRANKLKIILGESK